MWLEREGGARGGGLQLPLLGEEPRRRRCAACARCGHMSPGGGEARGPGGAPWRLRAAVLCKARRARRDVTSGGRGRAGLAASSTMRPRGARARVGEGSAGWAPRPLPPFLNSLRDTRGLGPGPR